MSAKQPRRPPSRRKPTPSPAPPKVRTTVIEDAELAALGRCLRELDRLDTAARRRLLDYLGNRYPATAAQEKRDHPVVGKEPGHPTAPEEPSTGLNLQINGAGGAYYPYHLPGDWGGVKYI